MNCADNKRGLTSINREWFTRTCISCLLLLSFPPAVPAPVLAVLALLLSGMLAREDELAILELRRFQRQHAAATPEQARLEAAIGFLDSQPPSRPPGRVSSQPPRIGVIRRKDCSGGCKLRRTAQ